MQLETDALFEEVMATRPLASTPNERLLERLQRRVFVHVSNYGEGDFRGGSGGSYPLPGEFGVYIGGNAYEIKDELKKLGFRWDRRSGQWYMRHVRTMGRQPRKNPSEKDVKKALEKAKKVIKKHNLEVDQRNVKHLAQAGFRPDEASGKKNQRQLAKEIDREVRAGKRYDRYGIDIKTRFLSRTGGEESAVITFSGNTYPIKDILKKAGFKFNKSGGKASWEMPFTDYKKIQRQLEQRVFKTLRKEMGDKPAGRPPSSGHRTAADQMKAIKSSPESYEAWKEKANVSYHRRRSRRESVTNFLARKRGLTG